MKKKLTLSIDKEVIERSKAYAKTKERSLSSLVEEYLKKISLDKNEINHLNIPKGSLVDMLTGVIDLPNNFDEKEWITEALLEKHLRIIKKS